MTFVKCFFKMFNTFDYKLWLLYVCFEGHWEFIEQHMEMNNHLVIKNSFIQFRYHNAVADSFVVFPFNFFYKGATSADFIVSGK